MLLEVLDHVLDGKALTREQASQAVGTIMTGRVRPERVAALLAALRTRGETGAELAGMAEAMRARMVRVRPPEGAMVVDVCGTGGDGAHTINVSTAAAFVVAAAGVVVAKHGNRSISSKCGSADVLEALGLRLDLPVPELERCLAEAGIAFLFAPAHHPAMKHVMPVRRALGVRTAFNLLGPMINPASAPRQVIGVFAPRFGRVVAEALGELGSEHVLVVCGDNGSGGPLDEISISGPTRAWELRDGAVDELELTPEGLGVLVSPLSALRGGDAKQNAAAMQSILAGEPGPRGDAVAVNSGAGLYVAGQVEDIREGVERSRALLAAGAGLEVLRALREIAR
jgi:anthranilate phosphoribosyltransferase